MRDVWQLTRPRLVLTVLFTVAVAAWSVREHGPDWWYLAHTLIGTALVIVGAIAFNQLIERNVDARMARTASRPLPTGRISPRIATIWGLITSVLGIAYLTATVHTAVVVTAGASWCIYVCLYTPLKRITVWHTAVGAVSGAMPILIGAATVEATFDPVACTLFAVVYLWQFPHTMAIGLLYRDQYAAASIRVAPVVDPSGHLAGGMAVVGAVLLIGASLLLPWLSPISSIFAGFLILLGGLYLWLSIRFARRFDDASARVLLRVSLVYLPVVLATYLVAVRC
jgi:protoheme IX farnesyltransferase